MRYSSEGSIFMRFLALVGVSVSVAAIVLGVEFAMGSLGDLHCFYSSPMSAPIQKPPVGKRYGVVLRWPTPDLSRSGPHHDGVYSIITAWGVEAPDPRYIEGYHL